VNVLNLKVLEISPNDAHGTNRRWPWGKLPYF
jgi:hypothetical protein